MSAQDWPFQSQNWVVQLKQSELLEHEEADANAREAIKDLIIINKIS